VVTDCAIVSGGGFSLTAIGAAGQAYVLLGATALAPPVLWVPVVTNVADTNGGFSFTDAQATNFPLRFYRVSVP
jgi:hypothetical protein